MKILFFTNEYNHERLPPSGGAGSSIKVLAHALSKKGHEVHVYGFSKKNISFKDGEVNLSFFRKYSKNFPFSEAARSISSKLKITSAELFFVEKERKYLAKKLKKYVLKYKIDIVESLAFNGYTAFWDNTVPLVIRFRGSRGFWHHYLNQPKSVHKIAMEQKALEGTPFTVAISKFSAKAVKKIYNIDVDKIIYNGIDHHLFAPNRNIQEIPHSIFYFGTLSVAKGVDVLCEIFNRIVEKYPAASLHLIGKGQNFWEQTCNRILSEKALRATVFHGPKNINELPQMVQKASVCAFTSRNENFGLVFAEAMALEKPVIAPDIPAAQEIIDHEENGFIARNTEDYVQFVSRMFEDTKQRVAIGVAAREKVLENFTKEVVVNETLDYYQNVLDRKKV